MRVVDAYVDTLDLAELGFDVAPEATGRPGYHPATLLKIYLYGYLNQVQSSRRLERECGRNLELIWLTGRLAPDFKTIADFRRDNGPAIRKVCPQLRRALPGHLHLLDGNAVAIDGSKFKAVNRQREELHARDRFGEADRRASRAPSTRYLGELDRADRSRGHRRPGILPPKSPGSHKASRTAQRKARAVCSRQSRLQMASTRVRRRCP